MSRAITDTAVLIALSPKGKCVYSELLQEFESTFDLSNGIFSKGWARHADGTLQEHKA